jgi:hypothetical protein
MKNETGKTCSSYEGEDIVYRILMGKYDGNRSLGRPRRRWKNNIKTDLQEVECGCMDWIDLAQDMEM